MFRRSSSSILVMIFLFLFATWASQAWAFPPPGLRPFGLLAPGWWSARNARVGAAAYYYGYGAPYYGDPGLDYPGYYPAETNSTTTDYSYPGSSQSGLPHPTGNSAVAPRDAGLIQLRLPYQFAEVSFDGQKVSSAGTTRTFMTPQLQQGENYRYLITVTWVQEGRLTTKEKTIAVRAGTVSSADFTPQVDSAKGR
jgi:uncharacterized protein (TIGR03000 family)